MTAIQNLPAHLHAGAGVALDYSSMIRLAVPAATFLSVGIQMVMAGFLASILDLKVTRS